MSNPVTIVSLVERFEKVGGKALVLQWYDGKWRAGIRTAAGLGPHVARDTALAALLGLLEHLEQAEAGAR